MADDVDDAPETVSEELQRRREIMDPRTGEILVLADLSVERMAEGVKEIQMLEDRLRQVKTEIGLEAHRRMDENARWTLEESGWKMSGSAPGKLEYDGERLKMALDLLVEDGRISQDAYDAALERVVSWKPKKAGINALLKLGPDVAELIYEAADPIPDDKRRVSITPPKGWGDLE